jgi:hypothetical protein
VRLGPVKLFLRHLVPLSCSNQQTSTEGIVPSGAKALINSSCYGPTKVVP